MTVKQEYDTECATMTFGEEEIDWKVMNIKMTIDKTGSQHPSWIYTPLYTKDIITPNLDSPDEDQYIIQQHPVDLVEESNEYETISVSETFDVEEAQWKENEAFRLTFDPTGKRNPQIQLIIMRKVPASQLTTGDLTDTVVPVPVPTVVKEREPTPEPTPELTPELTPEPTPEPTPELVRKQTPEPEHREPTPEPPPRPSTPVTVDTETTTIITETVIITDEPEPEPEPAVEETTMTTTTVISEPIVVKKLTKHVGGSVRVKHTKIFDAFDEPTGGTWILPDIKQFNKDIGAFIKDELIDIHMQHVLNTSAATNWWVDEIPGCSALWPMWQQQDTESFLRSLNFVLFGFRDMRIKIQAGLNSMLRNPNIKATVKQRWMYQLCLDQSKIGNSIYSGDHLDKRWDGVVGGGWCTYIQQLTEDPKTDTTPPTGCLVEPIHVYLLANVLCRPIVILTGKGKELSPEEDLSGIYLPFEHEPEEITKYPILLGYSHEISHFTPLVTAASQAKNGTAQAIQQSVPITDSLLTLLPVPFAVLPSEDWVPDENTSADITPLNNEETLQELAKYLFVSRVQYNKDGDTNTNVTIAAKLNTTAKPTGYDDLLRNYIKGAKGRFKNIKKTVKCRTAKCKRIPSSQLNGVCLKCHMKASKSDVSDN